MWPCKQNASAVQTAYKRRKVLIFNAVWDAIPWHLRGYCNRRALHFVGGVKIAYAEIGTPFSITECDELAVQLDVTLYCNSIQGCYT